MACSPQQARANFKGWLNSDGYQEDRVKAAIDRLGIPFILREAERESGLPKPVVHRVLRRLVKKGYLASIQMPISYPRPAKGDGFNVHRVYLYSRPEWNQDDGE